MINLRTSAIVVALATLALTGCKDAVDKIGDAVDGEPQTSYCEALCDWAVTCHEADRDIDVDSVRSACIADTSALDGDCAKAESGDLDAAGSLAVGECTDAIESAETANDCDAFTGRIDAIKTGTPPADCATLGTDAQGTYDGARESTQEAGGDMCDRYASTYCERLTTCLIGDFNVPQEAIDNIGEPQDLCEERLAGIFTDSCKADGLYDPAASLTDVNLVREAARDCIPALADMTCSDMLSGNFPPVCAGTFVDQQQALDFATGLLDVACMFNDFAGVSIPGC